MKKQPVRGATKKAIDKMKKFKPKPFKKTMLKSTAVKVRPAKKPPDKKTLPDEHLGMTGIRTTAQRSAVNGLVEFIRTIACLKDDVEVMIYGSRFTAVYDHPNPNQADDELESWHISEISMSRKADTGMVGTSIMRGDAESLPVVAAAEEFLRTFHIRPTGDDNDHLQSEWLLRFWWKIPGADRMRDVLHDLLWLSVRHPDQESAPGMTLAQALSYRPHGFYSDPILKDVTEIVDTLNEPQRHARVKRLMDGEKIVPNRIYELTFKGFDDSDAATDHLVKWVSASPTGLDAWLESSGVLAHLDEEPRDKARGMAPSIEDTILRYTFEDGIDLVITHTEAHIGFMDKSMTGTDPAPKWIAESKKALAGNNAGNSDDEDTPTKSDEEE